MEEPLLIVQRYQPFARFTPDVIREAAKARERLTKKGPCALLVIISPEIPVNASSTNDDHMRTESQKRSITAMAVVAENAEMYAANKFYFRYYPQSFDVKVFNDEDEARIWLKDKVKASFR
ncbi:MAG TPA: STAS/SEC14 domain-containing protein [Flavobacteriales bacterium]|nr:STAS/SEC14 domain-containing protein [Flavobacteriales bacterium]